MLGLLMIISLVHGMGVGVMPALFDEIKDALDIKHAQVGIIWGASALGSLLTSFLGGAAGDRFGAKRVIGAGLLLTAVTISIRAIFPTFTGLLVSMLLFGMSLGLVIPNESKAIGMWFGPKELGKALGLITVEGAAGYSISLMIGASLSSLLGGWEAVMWVMAAVTLGGFVIWMALAREMPSAAAVSTTQSLSTWHKLKIVIRVRDLWLVAFIGMCVGGALTANAGLLPETLVERGMSATAAGMYVSITTWTVAAFSIIGPTFSDRFAVRKLFIWPFLLICVGTVTFFGIVTGASLIIVLVVYSIGLGTAMPLFRALIIENERIGYRLAGSAIGFAGTVNGTGRMLVPFAMGSIMDITGEYWPAFLLLAAIFGVGALLATQVRETGLRVKEETSPGLPG